MQDHTPKIDRHTYYITDHSSGKPYRTFWGESLPNNFYYIKGNNFRDNNKKISGAEKAPNITGEDVDIDEKYECEIKHEEPQYEYYTTCDDMDEDMETNYQQDDQEDHG